MGSTGGATWKTEDAQEVLLSKSNRPANPRTEEARPVSLGLLAKAPGYPTTTMFCDPNPSPVQPSCHPSASLGRYRRCRIYSPTRSLRGISAEVEVGFSGS